MRGRADTDVGTSVVVNWDPRRDEASPALLAALASHRGVSPRAASSWVSLASRIRVWDFVTEGITGYRLTSSSSWDFAGLHRRHRGTSRAASWDFADGIADLQVDDAGLRPPSPKYSYQLNSTTAPRAIVLAAENELSLITIRFSSRRTS